MDLLKDCETFNKWIDSCETVEQLNLLIEVVTEFIKPARYEGEKFEVLTGAKTALRESIQFKIDLFKNKK